MYGPGGMGTVPGMSIPLWERERRWPLMRPFVYYLVEDFVPPDWIPGSRIVDFSAGLGDLTAYLLDHDAEHVIATVPETDFSAPLERARLDWRTGVLASRISEAFEPESVDLFCARMVFQFPRWEDEGVDVDVMLEQIAKVLAPGGRVLVATHAFFPLQNYPSLANEHDSELLLARLRQMADEAPGDAHEILAEDARRLGGLAEMVQYLGLPPRWSDSGRTGYGLRVPALVNSFLRGGYELEVVEDVEPFTYPLATWERFDSEEETIRELGAEVFSIKRRRLLSPAAADPYLRPGVVLEMLEEIRRVVDVVTVPIVRVAARKPGPDSG
jgi:SAM-dependent methyltransferase